MKTIQLNKGDLRTLNGDMKVVKGSVWITRENDLNDYVLEAGACFEAEGYLLEALSDVVLEETNVSSIGRKPSARSSKTGTRESRAEKNDGGLGPRRAGFDLFGGLATALRR